MANSQKDREEWNQELQRQSNEVYIDPGETKEVQEGRINHLKRKGDQHFTKCGREADITIDLVLPARAKMSENSQWTRRYHCKRDDQTVASGDNLHDAFF